MQTVENGVEYVAVVKREMIQVPGKASYLVTKLLLIFKELFSFRDSYKRIYKFGSYQEQYHVFVVFNSMV
jgi:hypothetical protein